jgi:carbon-monoxide dehydrogenase medium subunit
MRARNTENFCKDKEITEELIYEAGKKASEEASPITDVRSTREYRKMMVEIITRRAIMEAVELIRNK